MRGLLNKRTEFSFLKAPRACEVPLGFYAYTDGGTETLGKVNQQKRPRK
jgi:hypothetical protein